MESTDFNPIALWKTKIVYNLGFLSAIELTLLHSEWPKLYGVLAILSAIGLKSTVFYRFINIFLDVSVPLSSVYGVPLSTAMRLVKTLCQAGTNVAAIMVSLNTYIIFSDAIFMSKDDYVAR